eukprot:412243_1
MSTKSSAQTDLLSMGFPAPYIQRAFKIFEKNYGLSYNVDVLAEIVIRLQHKDRNKTWIKCYLSKDDALALGVGDKIDHRDTVDRFLLATVMAKNDTKLRICYDGWSAKWDIWSDFSVELHRFAKPCSISTRRAHRLKHLKKDDWVDINPQTRDPSPGWTHGEIRRLDKGQVQVCYEFNARDYLYWTHLDNEEELREVTPHNVKQIEHEATQLNWTLIKVEQDKNTLCRCIAMEIYGDVNKYHQVVDECNKYIKENASISKESQLIALSELYNVRIRVFKHIAIVISKLFMSFDTGDHETTLNLPLILLAQCNRAYYYIIQDPQTCHKRPLTTNDRSHDVSLRQLRLSKNKPIAAPPRKKRKLNNNAAVPSEDNDDKTVALRTTIEQLRHEIEQLKRQNNGLNQKSKTANFDLGHVDGLTEEQLDELEIKMQNNIKKIREAKDRLLEVKTRCIACLSNHKNIVIEGCNHFDLCDECEQKLDPKLCPRCQLPFEHVIKLKN